MIRRFVAPALVLATALAACGKSKVEPTEKLPAYAGDVPISSADPALRWINTEGGGAGWLPRPAKGEEQARSFMGVSDARGVKSVLAQQPRVAFSLEPGVVCEAAPLLAGARDRISIDITLGGPITPAVVDCIRTVRPPALSFYLADSASTTLPPTALALLTQLEGCEALGVHYADDAVATLLGERAASADGAALRSLSLPGSRFAPDALAALAKRTKLRAVALRGMSSTSSSKEHPGKTGVEVLATLPDLERLDLSYTAVSDAELAAFASAKGLRWLMLESTEIGDAGLAPLAGLPALEYVNVNATKVTEASLQPIVALPSLRALTAPSAIPAATVERWRREHPRLRIDHHPPG